MMMKSYVNGASVLVLSVITSTTDVVPSADALQLRPNRVTTVRRPADTPTTQRRPTTPRRSEEIRAEFRQATVAAAAKLREDEKAASTRRGGFSLRGGLVGIASSVAKTLSPTYEKSPPSVMAHLGGNGLKFVNHETAPSLEQNQGQERVRMTNYHQNNPWDTPQGKKALAALETYKKSTGVFTTKQQWLRYQDMMEWSDPENKDAFVNRRLAEDRASWKSANGKGNIDSVTGQSVRFNHRLAHEWVSKEVILDKNMEEDLTRRCSGLRTTSSSLRNRV